jgi:hypothetical protein
VKSFESLEIISESRYVLLLRYKTGSRFYKQKHFLNQENQIPSFLLRKKYLEIHLVRIIVSVFAKIMTSDE